MQVILRTIIDTGGHNNDYDVGAEMGWQQRQRWKLIKTFYSPFKSNL